MSNIDNIIYELTNDWDAIISVLKGNKRIVFINEVEYEFSSDEQLEDFYKAFKNMNKYLS